MFEFRNLEVIAINLMALLHVYLGLLAGARFAASRVFWMPKMLKKNFAIYQETKCACLSGLLWPIAQLRTRSLNAFAAAKNWVCGL